MNSIPGGARLRRVLQEAVADGTINPTQAAALRDRLLAKLPDGLPARLRNLPLRAELLRAVGERLRLDPATLRQRLASGQSLADIAAAQGVDRGTLLRVIELAVDAALDRATLTGYLPAGRRARVRAWLLPRAEQLIDARRSISRTV